MQGISFRAMAGQTIGVIGGTGSGKSTLVNLIPRFYDAASGQVLVDGTDVKDYPLDGLREKMGVVPQKSVLFKGTLRDNMRWGKQDASDEDIYRPWIRPRHGNSWIPRARAWTFTLTREAITCREASARD